MDVEGGAAGGKALKKKDAKREKAKRLRVPLFVAVAAGASFFLPPLEYLLHP